MGRLERGTGTVVACEKARKGDVRTRLPWVEGVATVKIGAGERRLRGRIPLVGPALRMRYSFYVNDGEPVCPMVPYEEERPRLDKRSIRLTAGHLLDTVHLAAQPVPAVRQQAAGVFVNVACVVEPAQARTLVGAYDREHGTQYLPVLLFVLHCVELVRRDDGFHMPEAKAVLVAQMLPLFESVYDVDFLNLMLVPFEDLLKIFRELHVDGPLAAFKRHDLVFDAQGFASGTRKTSAGSSSSSSSSSSSAPPKEGEGETSDERLSVVLQMSFARAWRLFMLQKASGRIDVSLDADDADDDATVALAARLTGAKRPADDSTGSGAPGATSSGRAFSIATPTGVVLMSSNGATTVGLPLDMGRLTRDQWLRLALMEELATRYKRDGAFGMPLPDAFSMVDAVNANADFPVHPITAAQLYESLLGMADDAHVAIIDLREGRSVFGGEMRARFPGAPPPEDDECWHVWEETLFLALPWVAAIESGTAKRLAEFMTHPARVAEVGASARAFLALPPADCDGVTFAPQQKQALARCAVMPLALVNGPGGTGKSLMLQRDYQNMVQAHPHWVLCYLAFKHDTVNQMRDAVLGADASRDPKDYDYKIFFRTVDSYTFVEGVLASAQDTRGVTVPVRADAIIIDEAGMLSASHFQKLVACTDVERLKQLKMFGDGEQLPPIMPGMPFAALLAAPEIAPATTTLTQNFRTGVARLMTYVTAVRERKFDSDEPIFDEYEQADGTNFHVSEVDTGAGDQLLEFGMRVRAILGRIDPRRKHHDDIMMVTPYNYMAEFLSDVANRFYFGPEQWSVADAVQAAAGRREKGRAAPRPVIYRGSDVVVTKTDRKNTQLAQGRIAVVTMIYDHLRGRVFEAGKPLPPDAIERESTATPLPGPFGRFERTVVLDGTVAATFPSDAALAMMLKPSKCRTIHRAQGRQAHTVICAFPMIFSEDKCMLDRRIWYTAVSRARSRCYTIASNAALQKMMTTEPPPPRSALSAFLRAEAGLAAALRTFAAQADEALATADAAAAMFSDEEDDDDDGAKGAVAADFLKVE